MVLDARTPLTGNVGKYHRDRFSVGELIGDVGTASVKETGGSSFRTLSDWMADITTAAVPIGAVIPVPLGDLSPAYHLSNLSGTGTRVINVIGDSTAVPRAADNNGIDDSQTLDAALQMRVRACNPNLVISWSNFAIGGTEWLDPLSTGTVLEGSRVLPAWFSNTALTWISYLEATAPDVVFIVFGTNASSGGATFEIESLLAALDAFAKVPNVIFISPPVNNNSVSPQAFHAMGSYIRTLCLSSANGFTSFTGISYLGLIDISRQYIAATEGFDPAIQYMEQVPSAVVSGTALPNGVDVGLGETTNGDFSVTLAFPGMGGTAMYGTGARNIQLICGDVVNNQVKFTFGSDGRWQVTMQSASSADEVTSALIFPSSGTVTVEASFRGERVVVKVNTTTALDTRKARYFNNFTPTISCNGSGSFSPNPTMNVTEFCNGIGMPVRMWTTSDDYFGAVGGVHGGSGVNHRSTIGTAVDRAVIDQINFAAPVISAHIPTSDTGLQSGMFWDNNAIITRVPTPGWRFIGRTTDAVVASGDWTGSEPAGTKVGDLLIAFIAYKSNAAFTLPADWTLVEEENTGNTASDATAIASAVMAYIVRGSSAPSYVFTRTAGNVAFGVIVAYRGCVASPADSSSSNTLVAAATTSTTTTITTAENYELLVCGSANARVGPAYTFDAATGATTASTPADGEDLATQPDWNKWIQRKYGSANVASGCGMGFAEAIMRTAGATGTVQATVAASAKGATIVGAFKRV